MKLPSVKLHSLPVQMVITLVGLVFLTAAAIGLPVIYYLRVESERYALRTLEQGGRTAHALISERRSHLESLALLTAQRPSLHRLLDQGDPVELRAYLGVLQQGAGLDLLLLCSPDDVPWFADEGALAESACRLNLETATLAQTGEGGLEGWLLSAQPLQLESAEGGVVVGLALDDNYAQALREQIGLDLALFLDDRLLASSLGPPDELELPEGESGAITVVGGESYYSHRVKDVGSGLELVFFLPASEVASLQGRLTRVAFGGILLVIVLSSAIGVARARLISRPLERLRDAAEGLRMGDLATPVVAQTRIREVRQVAQGLEEARRALQRSLGQLKREKAWVDNLLDAVVEGILTIDRGGRITYFSSGAERISGRKASEVLGCTLDEVFQVAGENASFGQRIPAPGGRQKIPVIVEGGKQKVLSVTGGQLAPPEAGRARAVLVLRDVSDEEVIRSLLGEFLANITHEFRTPLTALGASIELLMDQLSDLSQEELTHLLGSVHLGVLGLQTLIDNLLEGASIETGRFRVYPRPVQASEILQQAVETMKPLAEKYGQSIALECTAPLPVVQADQRRSVQVLVNLLSNAIKWGPSGGVITVRAQPEAEALRVSVLDQGPGLPAGLEGDLFARFDRAKAREGRGEYGAGLGLSVVKAVVEAQGGQVGACSRPEQGAMFWFTLPLADGEKEEAGE